MDALTHGLASYALTRAFFPRSKWIVFAGAIVAGTIADLDSLSGKLGPAAFLTWHRAVTHSVVGTLVIAIVVSTALALAQRRRAVKEPLKVILLAALAASLLHLLMDLCQNEGVEALWPFRAQRYSADWIAYFDLWILLILLAGALLPQLFRLVIEEIGAKSEAPRGRIGAALALAVVALYIGGRSILHRNAVALLESRTYRGEISRRAAALAEPDSPLHWRGIVETERALHEVELDFGPAAFFNPDGGFTSYKPETSPALEAAQNTKTARRFLQIAKFPRANVERTDTGFRVEIRDLANPREGHAERTVIASIELDPNANLLDEQFAWDRRSRVP